MDQENIRALLEGVKSNEVSLDDAIATLSKLPFEDLGFARIDHHRELRTGNPEVIFAEGKTPEQMAEILRVMITRGSNVLITRLSADKFAKIEAILAEGGADLPPLDYDAAARTLLARFKPFVDKGRGWIAVVCAGTSDLPVALEALNTVRAMNNRCELITDVGVAGIHRLLAKREHIATAEVVIAVAGMEGALPGVLTGMIDRPVIAVPTSVGYGASFNGISALLTMINSCASGLTVVNIDNGFGAAVAASLINRKRGES